MRSDCIVRYDKFAIRSTYGGAEGRGRGKPNEIRIKISI
jgi:hypothetical protein